MGLLFGLLFLVALPFGIAWVLASMLPELAPKLSRRARILFSAGMAGLLPTILPIYAIAESGDAGDALMIAIIAVAIGGVVIAVLIGLPAALFATRRKDPTGPVDRVFD